MDLLLSGIQTVFSPVVAGLDHAGRYARRCLWRASGYQRNDGHRFVHQLYLFYGPDYRHCVSFGRILCLDYGRKYYGNSI